jgi:hypothetical protein
VLFFCSHSFSCSQGWDGAQQDGAKIGNHQQQFKTSFSNFDHLMKKCDDFNPCSKNILVFVCVGHTYLQNL